MLIYDSWFSHPKDAEFLPSWYANATESHKAFCDKVRLRTLTWADVLIELQAQMPYHTFDDRVNCLLWTTEDRRTRVYVFSSDDLPDLLELIRAIMLENFQDANREFTTSDIDNYIFTGIKEALACYKS